MITIESMKVTKPFRYLWLKGVTGVTLSAHCAQSLKGSYDKRVSAFTKQLHNVELSEEVYYLCGVSAPYVWKNNFHLAFRHKQGGQIKYESNGIAVAIRNAERIEFSEYDIDPTHPKAGMAAYKTCRNWQFAHWFKNNVNG